MQFQTFLEQARRTLYVSRIISQCVGKPINFGSFLTLGVELQNGHCVHVEANADCAPLRLLYYKIYPQGPGQYSTLKGFKINTTQDLSKIPGWIKELGLLKPSSEPIEEGAFVISYIYALQVLSLIARILPEVRFTVHPGQIYFEGEKIPYYGALYFTSSQALILEKKRGWKRIEIQGTEDLTQVPSFLDFLMSP